MTKDDEFKLIAGVILAQLEDAFPVEARINERAAAEDCGVEVTEQESDPLYAKVYDAFAGSKYAYGSLPSGRPFLSVLWSTLKWLRDEGIIRAEGEYATEWIVLTSKAKDALGRASSDGNPIGDTMTNAARDIAAGENRSKLTTSVGEFIGSIVKGAFLS